ncbi:MAG TPA: hypothetical protein VMS56_03560 [Thermoanaerobaculia bacterium]|nr:hypothetical protein [Thermoanaerobaculia bacterium]
MQAYLQLNGYFTSAEYPVVAATAGSRKFRTVTDIDVLAFRFPGGARVVREGGPLPAGGVAELDPGLAIPEERVDMIIGEVKEGRVNFNHSATDPDVLATVLARFGCGAGDAPRVVDALRECGAVSTPEGHQVRLVAFGTMPPGDEVPPCRIIALGHVLRYLQEYVRRNWTMLRQCQFKDPALGFLMTLEKARRGGAGRRGQGGVEIVPGRGDADAVPNGGRRRSDRPPAEPLDAARRIPRGGR